MNGLDKIITKIEEDCAVICADVIQSAQDEAQQILKDAQVLGAKLKDAAIEAAIKQCEINIGLAISRSEHEQKKSILAVKSAIISEVIADSMKNLKGLQDADYFDTIKKLVHFYARQGKGIIHFSATDLKRLPKDFESDLNAMFVGNDKSIEISDQTISSDGGFMIAYGKIEQNCTFDSLLSDSLDEIKDEIFNQLFASGPL